MQAAKPMSNVQLELLKLYANDVPDEQLLEIKLLLGHYFADKATALMDEFMAEKGLTEKDMIKWANEHDRHEDRS
ncbi:MAG: hypothetical protein DHS20C18_10630 [Saprospiraceae bacterium]|nr:MAG: hypothetical protein DHS20C18_10630 [Saprospiraceae bacterium]